LNSVSPGSHLYQDTKIFVSWYNFYYQVHLICFLNFVQIFGELRQYNNFDGNVIYAYTMQILSIANKLSRNLDKEFFGIIITYKEMYWCNGLDCWDDLLKNPTIESCKNNNLDSSILPPENLYFIDIATWDKLIQIIKDTNVTLREILVKAKQDDSVTATKKGAFYLHTNQYDVGRLSLNYLNEPYKILDIDEGKIASKKSN
jgi:hypothetical protein